MQLVDEDAGGFDAGENVGREGFDLQGCVGFFVADAFEVRLHVDAAAEVIIGGDDALDLAEGDFGDLLRRRDEEVFGIGPLVEQELGEHGGSAVTRFRVLFRHQQEGLSMAHEISSVWAK